MPKKGTYILNGQIRNTGYATSACRAYVSMPNYSENHEVSSDVWHWHGVSVYYNGTANATVALSLNHTNFNWEVSPKNAYLEASYICG